MQSEQSKQSGDGAGHTPVAIAVGKKAEMLANEICFDAILRSVVDIDAYYSKNSQEIKRRDAIAQRIQQEINETAYSARTRACVNALSAHDTKTIEDNAATFGAALELRIALKETLSIYSIYSDDRESINRFKKLLAKAEARHV
jgi:hypothetical protein